MTQFHFVTQLGPYGGQMVEVKGKPKYFNSFDKTHHWEFTNETEEWKKAMGWQIKLQRPRIAVTPPIIIYVHHFYAKAKADAGAVFIATKACEDALTEMGVIPDDNLLFVEGLYFVKPQKHPYDALALELVEL